jgi:hypothetical protein
MRDVYISLDFVCPTCKKRVETASEIFPTVVSGGEMAHHYWCECREDFAIPVRFTQPKSGEDWQYYCSKYRENHEAYMDRLYAGEKCEPNYKQDYLALRKHADSSRIKTKGKQSKRVYGAAGRSK